MAKTAQGLINFCKSKIGTPYVYGGKGKALTRQQIQQLQNQYGKTAVWDSDLNKAGKVVVDCSGLISWYTGIVRGSSQYKSTAVQTLPISQRSNAHIGWAVWRQGHIGVYLGNNRYIAADGSAYGVREANLSQNNFTHLLKLCDVQYTGVGSTAGSTTNNPASSSASLVDWMKSKGMDSSFNARKVLATQHGIANYTGTANQNIDLLKILQGDSAGSTAPHPPIGECTGDGVRVRTAPNTKGKIVYTLYKQNRFDILGTQGNWTKVNIVGTVGWMHSDYVRRL